MDQDNAVNADVISDEEAEAAFNAGMNQVRGDRAPIDEEAKEKAVEAKAKREAKAKEAEQPKEGDKPTEEAAPKQAEAKADTEAKAKQDGQSSAKAEESEKEEPRVAGLKESEVKALLAKAAKVDELENQMKKLHDKTAGTMGNLSQAIKDLQTKPTNGKAQKVVSDQLKRLKGDFPELAERLADDLSDILAGNAGSDAPKIDMDEIDRRVEAKLAQAQYQSDVKRLDTVHPDRKQIVTSPAYGTWFALQPAEAQQMIRTSNSADFAIAAFNAFKDWQQHTAKANAASDEAGKTAKQRDKRLEDAMTPTGASADANGKRALTPEEEFEAGLKKVRGKRT